MLFGVAGDLHLAGSGGSDYFQIALKQCDPSESDCYCSIIESSLIFLYKNIP